MILKMATINVLATYLCLLLLLPSSAGCDSTVATGSSLHEHLEGKISTNINDTQQRERPLATTTRDTQQLFAKLEDETSTGSIIEFVHDNFITTGLMQPAPPSDSTSSINDNLIDRSEEISDSNSLAPQQAAGKQPKSKGQRQAENKQKAVDWWTKLIRDKKESSKAQSIKRGATEANDSKPTIYKEQPLKQNPILTIRNQLAAIRAKHRLLMVKAVPQLQRLDKRLVESYKMCQKRQMHLYAGMLYRTRGFVTRMAKEVKHERQVLESWARQFQRDLRQKIANKTLVKEYNRLVVTEPTISASEQKKLSTPVLGEPSRAQKSAKLRVFTQTSSEQISVSLSRSKKDSSQQDYDDYDGGWESPAEVGRISTKSDDNDDSIGATTTVASKSTSGEKRARGRSGTTSRTSSNQRKGGQKFVRLEQDQPSRPSRRPNGKRPNKYYTVHINEVNLKKELNKVQALVDRINTSTTELMAVVDDIVYLFKLTTTEPNNHSKKPLLGGKASKLDTELLQQQLQQHSNSTNRMMEQRKQAKRMLKSPIRVFLEKYGAGKLTMSPDLGLTITNPNGTVTNISEINMNNLPELKPSFDSASLAAFTESWSSALTGG